MAMAEGAAEALADGRLPEQVHTLPPTDSLGQILAVIKGRDASRNDLLFQSRRLIRLVIEMGLDYVPVSEKIVTTSTGEQFKGLEVASTICGVTILRGGQVMEEGLRECCKSVSICHLLIRNDESHVPKVYYGRLVRDLQHQHIMLMDSVIVTGHTVVTALKLLVANGAREENVTLLCLFAMPAGLHTILQSFPKIQIVVADTSDTCRDLDFSNRIFGTAL